LKATKNGVTNEASPADKMKGKEPRKVKSPALTKLMAKITLAELL